MDRYDERLIKGKPEFSTFLLLGLALLVVLIGVAIILLGYFGAGVLVIIGGFALGGFFKDGFDIEYEYILTNGDLEVANIIAKKRRKTVFTANEGDIKLMESADSDKVKNDLSLGKKAKRFTGKDTEDRLVAFYFGEGSTEKIVILDFDRKCIEHMKMVIKSRCNVTL